MSVNAAAFQQQEIPTYVPTHTVQVIGARWAVAAGHPLAALAAAQILEAGGNAVDAGVAGGMCLGVVQPDLVSFAGVAPILVHLPGQGETWQVSGVGPYPRAVSLAYFRDRHKGEIPPGLARSVVPAAPDAWCTALGRWGTMFFADVAAAALDCAGKGFPVSDFAAYQMAAHVEDYRQWPTSAALYLRDGRAVRPGEILVQAELAETIARMAAAERRAGGPRAAGIRAARDEVYRGETAKRIAAFHLAEDGPLAAEDLAAFAVDVEPALWGTFGDFQVATCGFWCQGPVLIQLLHLLDSVDLRALGHNSPRYLHWLVESIKVAFADREAYYGDPRFVRVPAETLLSREYAATRRGLVGERAWPDLPPPGGPFRHAAVPSGEALRHRGEGRSGPLGTSYIAVIDREGNAFSATPSDPNVDAPVVPGVGCVVSPRGSQGWLNPGHASVVAPGKRPRLTPAPAVAFRRGSLFMAFGTPGGDVQQQAMLQVFLNATVFGMAIQAAIEAPRVASRSFPDSFWPHPTAPGRVDGEARIPSATRQALADLGHEVSEWPPFDWRAGGVCAVQVGADGTRWAGADPRRGCHAAAR